MTVPRPGRGPLVRNRRSTLVGLAAMASVTVSGCGGVSIGIGGDESDPAQSSTASASSQEAGPSEPVPSSSASTSSQAPEPAATVGGSDPGSITASSSTEPAASSQDASAPQPTPTDRASAAESEPGADPSSGSPASGSSSDASASDASASSSDASASSADGGEEAADARGRVIQAPGIPHLGEAYRWESGLVAHVSKGEPYVPSSAAAGTDGFSQFLRFEVTLTNRAPESFRLSDFRIGAQSAGEQASQVFDSGNGINSLPAADLANGETRTFPVVFGVQDPDDTVLDVVQAFELSDRVVFLPAQE